MTSGKILRIQHQNKSDPSSSDDGVSIARTEKFERAESSPEGIELKPLALVKNEPEKQAEISFDSDRSTTETNFSSQVSKKFEKQESGYKRSRSYHGKGLFQDVVFDVVFELVIAFFTLSLYSLSLYPRSWCNSLLIL